MKSWEQFAEEVQPERQPGYSSGVVSPREDLPQSPVVEAKRERFTHNLKNKLMAMAMAGFVTLGGAWQKSYADQIKVVKKDGAAPEFILEAGITQEKLEAFKQKLEREEPEVMAWIQGLEGDIRKELEQFTHYIINLNEDEEARIAGADLTMGLSRITREVESIKLIKENSEKLKEFQIFLQNHLEEIILSNLLLDNSREARASAVRSIDSPKIYFSIFSHYAVNGLISSLPEEVLVSLGQKGRAEALNDCPDKWQPEIQILPKAFIKDGKIDFVRYVNTIIHELVHGLHAGADRKDLVVFPSPFRTMFTEGVTENISFEIIQYLGKFNPEIKPQIGTYYDERVIVASILDGILNTHDEGLLARWHIGLVDDEILKDKLGKAFENLGLDVRIAKDIEDFANAMASYEIVKPRELTIRILARLKLSGVEPSPEFIKDILTHGRILDDSRVFNFSFSASLSNSAETEAKKLMEKEKKN